MSTSPENIETPAPEPVEQVSVIIVSCNQIDRLRASLSALNAGVQDPAFHVIVVDNGSRDGSASLDSEFPAAQFIRLPQNFGLTKALNIGIRANDSAYVLFLHEDVVIQPAAIELLRARNWLSTQRNRKTACPLLLNEAGQPAAQVRDMPTAGIPDPPFRPGKYGEAPAVSNGAIMVRRFLLNALRNIDERYGNYGSDIELSMQVRRANKKIVIVYGATAVHSPESQNLPAAFAAKPASAAFDVPEITRLRCGREDA